MKRTWYAIAHGDPLGGGRVEDHLGKTEFFDAKTGTWWKHFGEATAFSSLVAAEAVMVECGMGEYSLGRTYPRTGFFVACFEEDRSPTSTLGEDADDADWWKRE